MYKRQDLTTLQRDANRLLGYSAQQTLDYVCLLYTSTAATLGMLAVLLPAFFLGMYEKNGQPMEKLLSYYVQSRFVRPKIRPYKTNNYYAILMKGGMTDVYKRQAKLFLGLTQALEKIK